jgi:hypothetical protein
MTPLELRTRLIAKGYTPLPDSGKACYLPGWPDVVVTVTLITTWEDGNTAIRADSLAIVDFDIDDPEVAGEAMEILYEVLGPTPVVRGRKGSPRFAAFYRREEACGKVQTGSYEGASVEVMCDRGKITAFGRHSSGSVYSWANESPLEVPLAELPLVIPEELEELVRALEALFVRRGIPKANGAGGKRGGKFTSSWDLTWDSVVGVEERGVMVPRKLEEIKEACGVVCLFARPDATTYHPLTFDNELPVIQDWNWWTMHRFNVDKMLIDAAGDTSGWKVLEKRSERPARSNGEALQAAVEIAGDFKDIDFPWLMKTSVPAIPWVLGGWLAAGQTTLIVAAPNTGKTRLLVSMALAVSSGDAKYLGDNTLVHEKGPVLVITNEEQTVDQHRRFKATVQLHNGKTGKVIARGGEAGAYMFIRRNEDGSLVIDQAAVDLVVEKGEGCKAILIDPMITLGEGLDENNNDIMLVCKCIKDIALRTGAAVLLMHHTPKDRTKSDNWYRGDIACARGFGGIGGAIDYMFTLARVRGDKEKNGDAPRLPEKERRRWLVLDTAKAREGLADVEEVFYLESHTLEQEGYDIGVIVPKTMDELRRAEGDYADEQLAEDKETIDHREELVKQIYTPGRYSINKVKEIMRKLPDWPHKSMSSKHDAFIKDLLRKSIHHDGKVCTMGADGKIKLHDE